MPGLVLSDFYLFGPMKSSIQGWLDTRDESDYEIGKTAYTWIFYKENLRVGFNNLGPQFVSWNLKIVETPKGLARLNKDSSYAENIDKV